MQIFKQMKRLTSLSRLQMSFLFVYKDEGQQRQLVKFAGSGEFLTKFERAEPLLSGKELKRSKNVDEKYFPKLKEPKEVHMATPSKMPCGPGVSKTIAEEQREMLSTPAIQTLSTDDSIVIDVSTPKRTRRGRVKKTVEAGRKHGKDKKKTRKRRRKASSSETSSEGAASDELVFEKLRESEDNDEEEDPESPTTTAVKETEKKKPKEDKTRQRSKGNEKQIAPCKEGENLSQVEDRALQPNIQEGENAEEEQDSSEGQFEVLASLLLEPGWQAPENVNLEEMLQTDTDVGTMEERLEERPDMTIDNVQQQQTEEAESENLCWEIGRYYAVGFEDRWYPGLVLEIKDENTAAMKFLHPAGKSFKWPSKDDIIDVNIKTVLCETDVAPNPTGRLWSVANPQAIQDLFDQGVAE